MDSTPTMTCKKSSYLSHICLVALAISQTPAIALHNADSYSFCEAESFTPVCDREEVVMVESAFYGRMRLGKCVQTDYGYVGCRADVLRQLDAKCSGRRSCKVSVPDKSLDTTNNCPKEFKTYLEANYTCVKVEGIQCAMCQSSKFAKLTADKGRIASVVSEENSGARGSGCGSAICPWLIEVRPGQKVNVTLYDFTVADKNLYSSDACFRYAVVKERGQRDSLACAGRSRVSHVMVSKTNQIEIHIVSPEVFSKKGQFIFYYEAIGCPDIAPLRNAYFTRNTRDANKATVGCVNTDAKRILKCTGGATEWDGEIPDCPGDMGTMIDASHGNALTLPLGVLIAIIIGIALIIGVLILTIGLICLKSFFHRQQNGNFRRPDTSSIYGRSRRSSEYQEEMSAATPLQYSMKKERQPEVVPDKMAFNPNIRENVYMESRPLPSIPDVEDDKSDKSSKVQVYRTSSGREHYHNPRLVVNTRDPRGGACVVEECDPQYFVLDPDELSAEEAPCPSTSGTRCRGGVQSDKQKSPEEENAENFCKEVLNNSCHEIPLRVAPPPPPQHTCCAHQGEDMQEGNSSWP